jgi:hypothetical protein
VGLVLFVVVVVVVVLVVVVVVATVVVVVVDRRLFGIVGLDARNILKFFHCILESRSWPQLQEKE